MFQMQQHANATRENSLQHSNATRENSLQRFVERLELENYLQLRQLA
jgi:hypothetical protein